MFEKYQKYIVLGVVALLSLTILIILFPRVMLLLLLLSALGIGKFITVFMDESKFILNEEAFTVFIRDYISSLENLLGRSLKDYSINLLYRDTSMISVSLDIMSYKPITQQEIKFAKVLLQRHYTINREKIFFKAVGVLDIVAADYLDNHFKIIIKIKKPRLKLWDKL